MRGEDLQQSALFSYLSPEQRVPKDHPLRKLLPLVDAALARMSRRFTAMYARAGRPSIAPEKLLRALLLQILYSVRSERLLMERLDHDLLFRWFVGLNVGPFRLRLWALRWSVAPGIPARIITADAPQNPKQYK